MNLSTTSCTTTSKDVYVLDVLQKSNINNNLFFEWSLMLSNSNDGQVLPLLTDNHKMTALPLFLCTQSQ